MIAHNIHYKNPNQDSWYKTYNDFLDEWDFKHLEKAGIVECWYSYSQGSYDGDGVLIGKSEKGLYSVKSLSHCSCYGPCDGAEAPHLTLEQLINYKGVDEYEKEIFENLIKQLV